MDWIEYVVHKEFKDMIEQNALLSDSLDYIIEALDFVDSHRRDLALIEFSRAKELVKMWQDRYTYLPDKTKRAIATGLLTLYERIEELSYVEDSEFEIDELIAASYDLIELAKIISVIKHWEKIRHKYIELKKEEANQ